MSYTARRALAGALLLAVVAVLVVLAAVFVPRWDRDEGGTFTVKATRVSAVIDPASVLIGDPAAATLRVFVDSQQIDPSTVRLKQSYLPFGSTVQRRTITRGIGSAARVDFAVTLQCVTVRCLTQAERILDGKTLIRPIELPKGTVTARTRAGAAIDPIEVTWPSIMVRSRLYTDQPDQLQPRVGAYRSPGVSTSISPSFLGWLSIVLAIVLALVGGTLVALAVRGRPILRRLRIPAHLTAVDRALALARHARSQGDTAGERRALERLAAALRDLGEAELGARAQRLAWSKELPSDDAFAELTRELERAGSGR